MFVIQKTCNWIMRPVFFCKHFQSLSNTLLDDFLLQLTNVSIPSNFRSKDNILQGVVQTTLIGSWYCWMFRMRIANFCIFLGTSASLRVQYRYISSAKVWSLQISAFIDFRHLKLDQRWELGEDNLKCLKTKISCSTNVPKCPVCSIILGTFEQFNVRSTKLQVRKDFSNLIKI